MLCVLCQVCMEAVRRTQAAERQARVGPLVAEAAQRPISHNVSASAFNID